MFQALDNITETKVPTPLIFENDIFRVRPYHTTDAPNLQNLAIRTNSNFALSTFKIGESSTGRENVVPNLDKLPNELQELYDGNDPRSRPFWKYIREYNTANVFTNLGVIMDDRVSPLRGPSSFVIYGELHHQIVLRQINLDTICHQLMKLQLYCQEMARKSLWSGDVEIEGVEKVLSRYVEIGFREASPCEWQSSADIEDIEFMVGTDEGDNVDNGNVVDELTIYYTIGDEHVRISKIISS
ncbi:hypothetical protein GIB67_003433 [Kingdonia uniflora]|uniref:Uncharacterized protein n=1 Tax=Kingdonia uniflora TaxID=39325 RepID=A0A7J7P912_9MAGN|nr:hypothetical protein GIB67_003433 [Kingdonia uniflora]